MKRILFILAVFAFLLACTIGSTPGVTTPGSNNPGNLNTPNPNNPSQDINTAVPPTEFAPGGPTPPGDDSVGPGTPTVPRLNDVQTPSILTGTPRPTASVTPNP